MLGQTALYWCVRVVVRPQERSQLPALALGEECRLPHPSRRRRCPVCPLGAGCEEQVDVPLGLAVVPVDEVLLEGPGKRAA